MFDYSVRFKAIDEVSRKIEQINRKMDTMTERAARVKRGVQQRLGRLNLRARFDISTEQAMAKLNRVEARMRGMRSWGRGQIGSGLGTLYSGAALATTALLPVNTARQYELAFKDVKKSVDGTPEELEALRAQMKAFQGASFEELAAINAEAGKMGFGAEKAMAFSDAIIKGAKALDFDAQTAVGQVGAILTMTNQMEDAIGNGAAIMDKVANLENRLSNVKAGGVVEIWQRNADLYSQLEFDNDQMAAMSGFLEQNFVSAELGASGFKIMINRFKQLESEFGFIDKIQTGGLEGLKDVMAEISKMTPEEQINKFGSEAMSLIAKLQSEANLEKLDFAFEVSMDAAGSVDREWALFRETFDEALNDTRKNVSNFADTIGKPMMQVARQWLSAINPIITKLDAWAKKNPELVKTIMKVAAVVGGFVAVLGVLAIIMGTVGLAIGALSPILLILSGRYGLLALMSGKAAAQQTFMGKVLRSIGWVVRAAAVGVYRLAIWALTTAAKIAAFSVWAVGKAVRGIAWLAQAALVKIWTFALWAGRGALMALKLGAGILGGGLKFLAMGVWSAVRATMAFTVALLANPITWVVIAVVALIAAIAALIYYWEDISAWVRKLWAQFMDTAWGAALVEIFNAVLVPLKLLRDVFGVIWDWVVGLWGKFADVSWGQLLSDAFNLILAPLRLLRDVFGVLFDWVSQLWAKFMDTTWGQLLIDAFNLLLSPITFVKDLVSGLFGMFNLSDGDVAPIAKIGDAFMGLFEPIQAAMSWIDDLLSKLDIYNNAKAGLASAWDWLTGGESEEEIAAMEARNAQVARSQVDVNVSATNGATATATTPQNQGVNLSTVDNGIGGA